MTNSNLLSAKGLHTFNNELSSVPEGSFKVAKNVNVDRTNVVEPRRGFKEWRFVGVSSSEVKQLIPYKNTILAQFDNKLAFDNGSGMTVYSPTFETADPQGYRMKYAVANGNLYLTTSQGIRKLSAKDDLATADISNAGAIRAIEGMAIPDYTKVGFLAAKSKVGYRITWGVKDKNGNVIEGVPSPIFEAINASESLSCVTKVKFFPPPNAQAGYFYRIYRTDVFTASTISELAQIPLLDELKLVYEGVYDGSPGEITVDDIASTFFRNNQINLYTNVISAEGIAQANAQPPYSLDIQNFNGFTFYANTKQKHFKLIDVLGTNSFLSYGGSQVYDVDENLALTTLNSTTVSGVTLSTSDVTIDFSPSRPSHFAVGSWVYITGTGIAGLDNNSFQVTAVTTNSITFNGSFTGTPNVARTAVWATYFQIKKGTLTPTRYFIAGLKEIEEFTFNGYSTTSERNTRYPNNKFIEIYSASDLIKYGIWFKHLASDTPPTFNGVTIAVDLTAYPTSATAVQVAQKFTEAIEQLTLDLEAVNSGATVRVVRVISGPSTNTVIDPAIIGITAHTIVQQGFGDSIPNKVILRPQALSPSVSIDTFTKSLCKVVNQNTVEHVNAYYIYNTDANPGKIEFQSKTWDDVAIEFDIAPSSLRTNFNPELPDVTDNLVAKNRLYYSKLRQPEAVPIANYIDIGVSDFPIERIVALQESLIIFKRDGIFKLTGTSPSSFYVQVLDKSAYLIAKDAVTSLNNVIFAFTSQGIVQVSEGGVGVISRPIENIITQYLSPSYSSLLRHMVMFSSEEDRALFFAVPTSTSDTVAKTIYRFNVFSGAWTEWTLSVRCGLSFNAKLYFGMGDQNSIDIERKDYSKYDYADRILIRQFPLSNFVAKDKFKLSNVAKLSAGDVIYQKQAVTVSKLKQLIGHLLNDPYVIALPPAQKAFYENFSVQAGDNIASKLTLLASQLNSDFFETFFTAFVNIPDTLFTQFNNFISQLNASPSLFFVNYQPLSSFTFHESPILKIEQISKIVHVVSGVPFIEGDTEVHKAIVSEIEYNPVSFGDTHSLKHVSYGTALFANASLFSAEIGYASDLSPTFDMIPFNLEGDGSWGVSFYDSTTWGGEGTQIPFRCTIPRQKQRCRFIRTKIRYGIAFFKFLLFGISFVVKGAGNNAYKS